MFLLCAFALSLDDTRYLQLAVEQARVAGQKGEVPIGAVLLAESVDGDPEVISCAHNQVETLSDASAHAEMLCMRQAAHARRNWRLLDSTLYCTLEPCAMCLSAALAFRVARIVYAAPDLRLGAVASWTTLPPHPFHTIEIEVTASIVLFLGSAPKPLLPERIQCCNCGARRQPIQQAQSMSFLLACSKTFLRGGE